MRYQLFIFLPLFLLAGCHSNSSTNPSVNNIDNQVTQISSHIQQISDQNHVYDNNNVNLNLLYESKQNLKNDTNQLISDYQNQQIASSEFQSALRKSLSALHFIWLEEFDAAYKNNNQDVMEKIRLEYNDFINQTEIQNYYQTNKKNEALDNLQNTFNEVILITNDYKKINENKTKLVSLKQNMDKLSADNQLVEYNQLVDEYNGLLENNNKLVNEYNQKIELYSPEKIYQSFLDLIYISDIFPQQTNLPFSKK